MLEFCIGLLKDTIDFVIKKKEINEQKKMKVSLVLEELSDIVKKEGLIVNGLFQSGI